MRFSGKIARLLGEAGRGASSIGDGATSERAASPVDEANTQCVDKDPARYRDRILALPGAASVAGKTVVIVGLGSVGSCVGAHLVRLGVHTIGCDPDVLAVENLIRWGLPASIGEHVGSAKARVWEAILRATVPEARVCGHVLDVVERAAELEAIVRTARPDLLVAATDTADSRRMVNAMACLHGVPALFVGLADGAASVRVEVVQDARSGPCHLCAVRAEGALQSMGERRRSRTPYAANATETITAGVPALPIDVVLGALVAARIALLMLANQSWQDYFRNGEQRGNVLFLSLRPDWWIFDGAWDRLVYQVERDPDCPACGEEALAGEPASFSTAAPERGPV